MTKYKIMIGGIIPDDCHSEMEVDGLERAKAWLHALARKKSPEKAIANIGDFRTWISNQNFQNIDISKSRIQQDVDKIIRDENISDAEAEVAYNEFIPDITVTPIEEGRAMVSSVAMQYEAPCSADRLCETITTLTHEYQDLIAAGELSKPSY